MEKVVGGEELYALFLLGITDVNPLSKNDIKDKVYKNFYYTDGNIQFYFKEEQGSGISEVQYINSLIKGRSYISYVSRKKVVFSNKYKIV